MINIKEHENLSILNHSCAHLLAHAVKRLYPHAKFWVGPVISEGFYYDIDLGDNVITESDLELIEKEMKRISKSDKLIKRIELSKEEALGMFKNDEYKIDIINNLEDGEVISAYKQDDFIDLCRGPHVNSTKELKHFKLLKVSGSYYKGDANNKMLQRVYGICFATEEDLQKHLEFLEEVKLRDHRKLGKELELFMFSEEAPGMPFYLPKGMIIRNELETYARELGVERNYREVRTPLMMNKRLWEQSGHWDHYHENMYFTKVDEFEFALKPMNCPGHMLIYKNNLYSYRDLPLRISEFGQVHRHEFSGALNGMMRVRTFCQDDAHIFVRPDQIEDEITNIIELIDTMYQTFGFTYKIELSTRPEDSMGSDELWNQAETALKNVLENSGRDYQLNEGDGAFYGPKIDFHISDALGRSWQCATIQLDFQFPEKFDLHYISSENEKERPVVIHRAVYGSIDRFLGIITEHFAGAFPLWLAPVQVNIITVNNEYHLDYAQELKRILEAETIRVELDSREEKLGYRMRESQVKKIPYTLIIGDNERDNRLVSYRKYGTNETITLSIDEFIKFLQEKIANKDRSL